MFNVNPFAMPSIPTISPAEAAQSIQDFRLVDVREVPEYYGPAGHVPGAELAPLSNLSILAPQWKRNEKILVMCQSGGRSAKAVQMLQGMGFDDVTNMAGGMMGWLSHGLPNCGSSHAPKEGVQAACDNQG